MFLYMFVCGIEPKGTRNAVYGWSISSAVTNWLTAKKHRTFAIQQATPPLKPDSERVCLCVCYRGNEICDGLPNPSSSKTQDTHS